jgi:preprotein translocase subunit SecD
MTQLRCTAVAGLAFLCVAVGLCAAGALAARPAGIEVVLEPVPAAHAPVTASHVARTDAIVRARISRLHVDGVLARKPGSQLIVLRVSGPAATARREIAAISEPGVIDFYDLTPSLARPSIDASREPVPSTSLSALRRRAGAGSFVVVSCSSSVAVVCPGPAGGVLPTPGTTYYYLFKHDPAPGGGDLVASATRADKDPTTGAPIVTIRFTRRGDALFQKVTRVEAQRGRTLGTEQNVAIVLDDEIRSFPEIDYHAYPNGIDPAGSSVEITGLSSTTQAESLAAVLGTGALPLRLVTVSERVVH